MFWLVKDQEQLSSTKPKPRQAHEATWNCKNDQVNTCMRKDVGEVGWWGTLETGAWAAAEYHPFYGFSSSNHSCLLLSHLCFPGEAKSQSRTKEKLTLLKDFMPENTEKTEERRDTSPCPEWSHVEGMCGFLCGEAALVQPMHTSAILCPPQRTVEETEKKKSSITTNPLVSELLPRFCWPWGRNTWPLPFLPKLILGMGLIDQKDWQWLLWPLKDLVGLFSQDLKAQLEFLMLCPSRETDFPGLSFLNEWLIFFPHCMPWMLEWCQWWTLSQPSDLMVLSSTFSNLRGMFRTVQLL